MTKSKELNNAPLMDIRSEYMQRVREENKAFLFSIFIAVIIVGSLAATIWMGHENSVLNQIINSR